MKLVKKVLKSILKLFGYDVIKIDRQVKRVIYCAHFRGHGFFCVKDDPLTESVLTGSGWDNQLLPELKEHFSGKSALIVEVGANIGTSLMTIANEVPNLNFECFEPVPEFYSLLKRNLQSFGPKNVKIEQKIFGEKLGEKVVLNVGLGTAGASSLSHYQQDGGIVEMSASTLDHIYHNREFHFLKLDVDGHELSVLKGGENVIRRYRPYIFMEYSYKIMDTMNINPRALLGQLEKMGYQRAKVWDSSGDFLETVNKISDIDVIARKCVHYADVLFLP